MRDASMSNKATKKAPNVEERPTHYRVRIARRDATGTLQKYTQKFYWSDAQQSKKQALAKARAFATSEISHLMTEGKPRSSVGKNLTVRDLVKRYETEGLPKLKNGRSTASMITVILSTFDDPRTGQPVEYFGNILAMGADKLTAKTLLGDDETSFVSIYKATRPNKAKEPAKGTIRKYVNAFGSVYTYAINVLEIDVEHPLKGKRKHHGLEVADFRDTVVGDTDFEKVLAHLKNGKKTKKRKEVIAVVQILHGAACRRGEIVHLQKQNVLKEEGQFMKLIFPDTKNGEKRIIPLQEKEEGILNEILKNVPEDRDNVFTIQPDSVTQAWGRAREELKKKLKEPKARIHDLRHTAISYLAGEAEIPIQDLAKITGHKDLNSLNRYYHKTAERLGQQVKEAEERLKAKNHKAS